MTIKQSKGAYDRYAKAHNGDNIVEIPFDCPYCGRKRFDLELIDGDGKPMCNNCFEGMVALLKEVSKD